MSGEESKQGEGWTVARVTLCVLALPAMLLVRWCLVGIWQVILWILSLLP